MIIYFSATGNSRFTAASLAEHLGDRLELITDLKGDVLLSDNERVVFVFPIHSWGMPKGLSERISNMRFSRTADAFMVGVCGDDTGLAEQEWEKAIAPTRLNPIAEYSIRMPNTYVLLPGFDVDSDEVESRKLTAAPKAIQHIANAIASGNTGDHTHHGGFAFIKSKVIRPFFMRAISDKKFRCDVVKCVSCGKCSKVCPVQNIAMVDGHPQWQGNCINCLACYHYCTCKAIQYGSSTKNKGQYRFRKNNVNNEK